MSEKIPCINCITLSICKAFAQENRRNYNEDPHHDRHGRFFAYVLVEKLSSKCSLVKQHCTVRDFTHWSVETSKIAKFLIQNEKETNVYK